MNYCMQLDYRIEYQVYCNSKLRGNTRTSFAPSDQKLLVHYLCVLSASSLFNTRETWYTWYTYIGDRLFSILIEFYCYFPEFYCYYFMCLATIWLVEILLKNLIYCSDKTAFCQRDIFERGFYQPANVSLSKCIQRNHLSEKPNDQVTFHNF